MKTITFLLLTLLMTPFQGFASEGKVKLPQQGALFGAYVEAGALSDHPTSKAITDFQNQVGHKLSWVYFSNNWLDQKIKFPSEKCANLYLQRNHPLHTTHALVSH